MMKPVYLVEMLYGGWGLTAACLTVEEAKLEFKAVKARHPQNAVRLVQVLEEVEPCREEPAAKQPPVRESTR